jgi:hypothetical protein
MGEILLVLVGLPHAAHAASRKIRTDITIGFFFLQLPRKSQLLTSGGSSISITQSILDYVPPTPLYTEKPALQYRHSASRQGNEGGPRLTLLRYGQTVHVPVPILAERCH